MVHPLGVTGAGSTAPGPLYLPCLSPGSQSQYLYRGPLAVTRAGLDPHLATKARSQKEEKREGGEKKKEKEGEKEKGKRREERGGGF